MYIAAGMVACIYSFVNVMSITTQKLYKRLPETPGVYLMKGTSRTRASGTVRGTHGRVLYIGKAANLRRRVSSYFTRPHDSRIEKMVNEVRRIDYKKTDTALEALILEAALIKKYKPPYNIREKDDKSFLYVEITDEAFPRVLLVRGKTLRQAQGKRYGPFTSASSIREALRIIRRIFPFSIHPPHKQVMWGASSPKKSRACFDYEIGLCPGTCVGAISKKDYLKNIRNIKLLFEGKKKTILKNLDKEMYTASKKLEFEKAVKLRKQIFALQHIQDVALIGDFESQMSNVKGQMLRRVEGYDVSNISGTSAVGAMVVFANGRPDKNEYRKFKIRTIMKSDDVGMLREILRRRFGNNWSLPHLILIDGGKHQVNAAKSVLSECGLKIPVVGIAKGPKRKKNEFIGQVPRGVDKNVLIRVRDEAHRFAVQYHRKVRGDKLRE